MATTGFWPIKGSLKGLIAYAENPSKTTAAKYLDEDLYRALRYVENDNKTDRKMYVTAINCPSKRAYESMMATKKRYGKTGGNVAYHAYQSFRAGEVTPELAHEIGLETARRMWGRDYEIVVTTHLNTDNIHNHMIVNSVSFRTGRKFENHQSDHYKLREISDEICREKALSVLPPRKFSGNHKKDYWVHKKGNLTHRDILRRDIESILPYCDGRLTLENRLRSLGYEVVRGDDYRHTTIIAPGWKRPVRLDSLGYTNEVLNRRFDENVEKEDFYILYNTPYRRFKSYPLLNLEKQLDYDIRHERDTATVLVDVLFYIILQLILLAKDEQQLSKGNIPHAPSMRQAVSMEKQLSAEFYLLKHHDLHSVRDIMDFIEKSSSEISRLENERKEIRNSNRRPKSPEEHEQKLRAAREISAKIKPLRKELKDAEAALERYPRVWELLKTEHEKERIARNRERNRER